MKTQTFMVQYFRIDACFNGKYGNCRANTSFRTYLNTPKGADFAEFLFQARRFSAGIPMYVNEKQRCVGQKSSERCP